MAGEYVFWKSKTNSRRLLRRTRQEEVLESNKKVGTQVP